MKCTGSRQANTAGSSLLLPEEGWGGKLERGLKANKENKPKRESSRLFREPLGAKGAYGKRKRGGEFGERTNEPGN